MISVCVSKYYTNTVNVINYIKQIEPDSFKQYMYFENKLCYNELLKFGNRFTLMYKFYENYERILFSSLWE